MASVLTPQVMGWLRWVFVEVNDIPFDLCWTAHVAFSRREWKYNSYLYALASCMVFSFGGYSSARLLAGEAPGVLGGNLDLPVSILVWFIMMFTPFHHIYRLLPVRYIFVAGEGICMMRSVVAAVDLAILKFPGSVVAAGILGILGGAGAGLWMNYEQRFFGVSQSTYTGGVKLAAFSTLFYYSQHPGAVAIPYIPHFFTLVDAKIVLGIFLVVCCWAEEIFDYCFNPWWLWESFFLNYIAHDPLAHKGGKGSHSQQPSDGRQTPKTKRKNKKNKAKAE